MAFELMLVMWLYALLTIANSLDHNAGPKLPRGNFSVSYRWKLQTITCNHHSSSLTYINLRRKNDRGSYVARLSLRSNTIVLKESSDRRHCNVQGRLADDQSFLELTCLQTARLADLSWEDLICDWDGTELPATVSTRPAAVLECVAQKLEENNSAGSSGEPKPRGNSELIISFSLGDHRQTFDTRNMSRELASYNYFENKSPAFHRMDENASMIKAIVAVAQNGGSSLSKEECDLRVGNQVWRIHQMKAKVSISAPSQFSQVAIIAVLLSFAALGAVIALVIYYINYRRRKICQQNISGRQPMLA